MSEVDITRDEGESKGRYVLTIDGHEADLTYSILSPHTRIADHTAVPDALCGIGAGLLRLVADARAEGWKPCRFGPFVNRQCAKHPDWADAFNV